MVEVNGFESSHAQRKKHLEIVGAIWHRRRAVGDSISGVQTCVKDDPVISFGFKIFFCFFLNSDHCPKANYSIQSTLRYIMKVGQSGIYDGVWGEGHL